MDPSLSCHQASASSSSIVERYEIVHVVREIRILDILDRFWNIWESVFEF